MDSRNGRLDPYTRDGRQTVTMMTDAHEPASSSRCKIRARFMETDKGQTAAYVKDLEKTIQINKGILSDLLMNTKMEETQRKVLEKLNQENVVMQGQVRRAIKERDDTQAKLLISEQLTEQMRDKQAEIFEECEERTKDLAARLDFSDYNFQALQMRYNKAEAALKRYATKVPEIGAAYTELCKEASATQTKGMRGLLEENKDIATELAATKKRLEEAETRAYNLSMQNEKLNLAISEMRVGAPAAKVTEKKMAIPRLDLSKVKGSQGEDTAYVHKLEESIRLLNVRLKALEDENRDLTQKNMQLENTNSNLFKLNMTVSKTLQDTRAQLAWMKGRRQGGESSNRSAMSNIAFRTTTDPGDALSFVPTIDPVMPPVTASERAAVMLKRKREAEQKRVADESFGRGEDLKQNK